MKAHFGPWMRIMVRRASSDGGDQDLAGIARAGRDV